MQRRQFLNHIAKSGGVLGLLSAVAAAEARPRGVTIRRVNYKGWQDAICLSNGMVEVVVVPSVARIMRYGYVGGPNILWENPTVAGKPIPLRTWAAGGGTGGDKIWPWPQDEWGTLFGSDWPPPAGADQAPYQAEIVAHDTLRMISPPIVPLGLRIVRDIRLYDSGTEVSITSRFVKYRDRGTPNPIAVWAVTQVPIGRGMVYIRESERSDSKITAGRYKPLMPEPFASVTALSGQGSLLRFDRNPAVSSKIGMEGNLIAIVAGKTLFRIRYDTPLDNANPQTNPTENHPQERTQLYAQPDNAGDRQKGITPYFELEMTSSRRMLTRTDETVALEVSWSLEELNIKNDDVDEAVFWPLLQPPVLNGTP